LRPLPPPITDRDQIARLDIRRRQRLGGILNEYRDAVFGTHMRAATPNFERQALLSKTGFISASVPFA
jgi:hypothetical protein